MTKWSDSNTKLFLPPSFSPPRAIAGGFFVSACRAALISARPQAEPQTARAGASSDDCAANSANTACGICCICRGTFPQPARASAGGFFIGQHPMRRSNAAIAENLQRVRDDLEKCATPRERKQGSFYSCFLQLGDLVRELSAGPSPKEVVAAAKKPAAPRLKFTPGDVVVSGNVIHVEHRFRRAE